MRYVLITSERNEERFMAGYLHGPVVGRPRSPEGMALHRREQMTRLRALLAKRFSALDARASLSELASR